MFLRRFQIPKAKRIIVFRPLISCWKWLLKDAIRLWVIYKESKFLLSKGFIFEIWALMIVGLEPLETWGAPYPIFFLAYCLPYSWNWRTDYHINKLRSRSPFLIKWEGNWQFVFAKLIHLLGLSAVLSRSKQMSRIPGFQMKTKAAIGQVWRPSF